MDSTTAPGPSGLQFNKEIRIPTSWGHLAGNFSSYSFCFSALIMST